MKVAALSLCTLIGVVDSHDNGVYSIIVSPTVEKDEYLTVTLTGEYLPPDTSEGDTLLFTVLADDKYDNYCKDSL